MSPVTSNAKPGLPHLARAWGSLKWVRSRACLANVCCRGVVAFQSLPSSPPGGVLSTTVQDYVKAVSVRKSAAAWEESLDHDSNVCNNGGERNWPLDPDLKNHIESLSLFVLDPLGIEEMSWVENLSVFRFVPTSHLMVKRSQQK